MNEVFNNTQAYSYQKPQVGNFNYKDFLDIKSKNESNQSILETPDAISLTNDSVENFELIEEANKIQFSQVDLI
jgi:hypothetical protein